MKDLENVLKALKRSQSPDHPENVNSEDEKYIFISLSNF